MRLPPNPTYRNLFIFHLKLARIGSKIEPNSNERQSKLPSLSLFSTNPLSIFFFPPKEKAPPIFLSTGIPYKFAITVKKSHRYRVGIRNNSDERKRPRLWATPGPVGGCRVQGDERERDGEERWPTPRNAPSAHANKSPRFWIFRVKRDGKGKAGE